MSSDPFSNLPPADDNERTVIKPVNTMSTGAFPAGSPTGPSPTLMPSSAPSSGNPKGDHDSILPVGTYLGEFEITDLVGQGGFGIVYLAWDHSLERRVALKEYMPAALAMRTEGMTVQVKAARHQETFEAGLRSFVNEAKLLAQFDHPSMVKVYRFWEANSTAYMVMPFYEGDTLKDMLAGMDTPPDEAWLTAMLVPLTEALEVLHNQQCYHRDIAPDNIILLKGSGKPLLLDFGAARRVIGDMTQALTVILKSGYAPVEQYAEVPGMRQGPWTDVYALAAVVYYCIHGKTPPPSVGRLVNDSYVPLVQSAAGKYSERFLAAVDRALIVKPDERTQSMGEFRQSLGVGAGYVPPTEMPDPHGRARKSSGSADKGGKPAAGKPASSAGDSGGTGKRLPLIIGGAVTAVAVLAGIGYAVLGGSGEPAAASAASAPASTVAAVTPAPTTPAVTPAPVPAAQDAPPTDPFDPIKELQHIVEHGSAGFTVEATATKPRFKIGKDRLSFSFTSSKPGYAYVLLVSTDGAFMKLFPNRMAQHNRVDAGEHITLPHSSWPMDVAGPAGTDHFVVIVSTYPRDFSAAGERVDGGFAEFPREQAEAAYMAHRGGGSVFAGKAICNNGTPCADEYGAATFTLEEYE
ncbi:MAG TPA: serine/threonine-protein kinase [Aquabacterium sp.]|uniref:serine/threonine-protein kinase n=1 Tax=Aquabacterium sp. TaxID=1872578 RepID=UPI002E3482F4|nr:serine/threonine-protein kinase [Aquabacterium sp.]HEX5373948.1 serine/threonine-protein kinase [Aquabacterium sp.]